MKKNKCIDIDKLIIRILSLALFVAIVIYMKNDPETIPANAKDYITDRGFIGFVGMSILLLINVTKRHLYIEL